MIKIGDIKTIVIENNTNLGDGVSRINNIPIYVPNTLIGDTVEVQITEIKKKYLKGRINKIIECSNLRINPPCPYFPICGGCTFQHTNITTENQIKENYIKKIFPVAKINKIVSTNEIYYRNKVTFHVKEGKLGLYQKNTNQLIEVDNCIILNKEINKIIKYLQSLNLNEVEQIMIRYAQATDELLINITGKLKDYEPLTTINNIKSIYINNKLIYKNPFIYEKIGKYTFAIGPNSFFQVNTNIIKTLYDTIENHITNQNSLLDLYCGVGTIGIYLNKHYEKILGIDIIEENIINANHNKNINQIKNITFKKQDAKDIKEKYFDTVIVDPPRSGLGQKTINNLLTIKPKTIIYVSCNPNTLKKDITYLNKFYELKEITPINMFPKTEHIECVCVLNRR